MSISERAAMNAPLPKADFRAMKQWSPDRRKLVADALQKGHAYSAIALQLGTTRSTIAGVVRRMKDRGEVAAHPTLVMVPVPDKPEYIQKPTHVWSSSPVWLPLKGRTPVALEQHREGTCRWPVGERLYCGADIHGESRYCRPHHRQGIRTI